MAVISRTTTTYSYRHLSRRHFDKETKAFAANTFSRSAWVSAKKPSPTQRIVTRGGRVIVAASPPTKDVVVVTDPLTKKDIVDYLASGFCGHANDNSAAVVAAVSVGNKAEGNDGGAAKKLVLFGNAAITFDLEDLLRASTEVLGKGTFGTTYKAVLEARPVVAVKRLKDATISEKDFKEKIDGE